MTDHVDRSQLQDIIAELTDGVILIEPDQTIAYANEAALRMHGVGRLEDLGRTVGEYRDNFALRYRNNRPVEPGRYPIDRVVAGEIFDEVVVVVARRDNSGHDWTHRIRGVVLTDEGGGLLPDVAEAARRVATVRDVVVAEDGLPAGTCRFHRTRGRGERSGARYGPARPA